MTAGLRSLAALKAITGMVEALRGQDTAYDSEDCRVALPGPDWFLFSKTEADGTLERLAGSPMLPLFFALTSTARRVPTTALELRAAATEYATFIYRHGSMLRRNLNFGSTNTLPAVTMRDDCPVGPVAEIESYVQLPHPHQGEFYFLEMAACTGGRLYFVGAGIDVKLANMGGQAILNDLLGSVRLAGEYLLPPLGDDVRAKIMNKEQVIFRGADPQSVETETVGDVKT